MDWNTFKSEISQNIDREIEKIQKAYNLAEVAHKGQFRKGSGDVYFIHPYRVALLLKTYDDTLIMTGLLHDVV